MILMSYPIRVDHLDLEAVAQHVPSPQQVGTPNTQSEGERISYPQGTIKDSGDTSAGAIRPNYIDRLRSGVRGENSEA